MVFSTSLFLIYFFPIFLIIYFLVKKEFKNTVVLIASILFYAWGGKLFTFVLLGTLVLDFILVQKLDSAKKENKKGLFLSSIFINLGLLIYFKYSNFFIENVDSILGNSSNWSKVVLPIGISFITFHKMSYSFDVYRGTYQPLKSFKDYALYILLFPQLIAGPIVRYNEIADQLIDREKNETIDNKILGFFRFAIGLGKKVLIANVLGESATEIMSLDPHTLSAYQAWAGAILYTFHIYFDFSGYSDMAIGIARMIGFKFPENFNFPYMAQNITEFWQRWHITLGRWMRDYLYIPLGGNKVTVNRMYINLSIVFLLSGLWHGASWNFVIWGVFHGFFLILDRLFLIDFNKKIGKVPSIALTFFITILGWVIFASKDAAQIISYMSAMFGQGNSSALIILHFQTWVLLVVAVVFSFTPLLKGVESKLCFWESISVLSGKQAVFLAVIIFVLVSISLCYVAGSGFNPFIYFRF